MKQFLIFKMGISIPVFLLVMLFFIVGCGKKSESGPIIGTPGKEDFKYKPKGEHKGGDVTPEQAYKMIQEDPEHTFLVDVRTRYEYQDIGHPVGAYNIPWKFYTTNAGKKGYKKKLNSNFCKDLKARFNPKTGKLLMLCRSAQRTIKSSTTAVDCGFKEENVFNIMGGFEGDKDKNRKRTRYGWRLEGLPWTYKMNPQFMYNRDIKKD